MAVEMGMWPSDEQLGGPVGKDYNLLVKAEKKAAILKDEVREQSSFFWAEPGATAKPFSATLEKNRFSIKAFEKGGLGVQVYHVIKSIDAKGKETEMICFDFTGDLFGMPYKNVRLLQMARSRFSTPSTKPLLDLIDQVFANDTVDSPTLRVNGFILVDGLEESSKYFKLTIAGLPTIDVPSEPGTNVFLKRGFDCVGAVLRPWLRLPGHWAVAKSDTVPSDPPGGTRPGKEMGENEKTKEGASDVKVEGGSNEKIKSQSKPKKKKKSKCWFIVRTTRQQNAAIVYLDPRDFTLENRISSKPFRGKKRTASKAKSDEPGASSDQNSSDSEEKIGRPSAKKRSTASKKRTSASKASTSSAKKSGKKKSGNKKTETSGSTRSEQFSIDSEEELDRPSSQKRKIAPKGPASSLKKAGKSSGTRYEHLSSDSEEEPTRPSPQNRAIASKGQASPPAPLNSNNQSSSRLAPVESDSDEEIVRPPRKKHRV